MPSRLFVSPLRLRHFVLGIMLAVALTMIVIFAALVIQSHQRMMHEGKQITRDMAKLMQNQMIHILDVANTILSLERIEQDGNVSVRNTHRPLLLNLVRDKPYLFRIFLSDSKGDVIATSMTDPPPLNIAARSYFNLHQRGVVGPIITTGVQSQASGEPIIIMSRALLNPAGQFVGVATVSFNLDGLAQYFEKLAPTEYGSVFQLIVHDGRILVDVSPPPELRYRLVEPEIWDVIKTNRTDVAIYESLDHVPRIWAHRSIPGTDLFIRVGTDRAQITRKWHQDLIDYAMVALLAFAGLTVLTLLAVRYADREEKERNDLRVRNDQLEQALSARTAEHGS